MRATNLPAPRQLALGVILAALIGSALAACASGTTSASTLTAPIHLVFEAIPSAQVGSDLRENLVALDTRDGHVVWKHPLETPSAEDGDYALHPAVYQNGLVYFTYYYTLPGSGGRHNILEALDAATGTTRWSHEIGAGDADEQEAELVGLPIVVDSTVYLTATVSRASGPAGFATAFDATSGKMRWSVDFPDMPKMPAVVNGMVYILTSAAQGFNARLLALHANDGSTAWQYTSDIPLTRGGDQDNGPTTAPVISGGLVFVQAVARYPDGTADMEQLAVNTRDGSLAWQYETGGIAPAPAISQDGATLCLGITLYGQNSSTAHVVALATANGQTQWSATPTGYASGCVASGDLFLVNTRSFSGTDGTLLALTNRDGKQAWEITTGPPVAADGILAPTVANDVAVESVAPSDEVGPTKTIIRVVSVSRHAVQWSHEYDGHVETLADIEGVHVYTSEQQTAAKLIVAYSLSTGAKLWSYTLGSS